VAPVSNRINQASGIDHLRHEELTAPIGYDNISRVLNTTTTGFNGAPIPGVVSRHNDSPGVDQIGTGTYPFAHERIDTDALGHITT
jgi:hypothetical protein